MIPRNTPRQLTDAPIVQWASGRTEARMAGAARFTGHVGFHVEAGKDDAFDRLAHAAGVPRMEIRHQREGAAAVIASHWSLGELLSFWPLTAGPPYASLSGLLRSPETAAAGIGAIWPAGGRSKLALRGYISLGDAVALVQLAVRSTMTDHLLAALLDHVRVCEIADTLADRAKHPDAVGLWELALNLGAGPEIAAGKQETTTITPLISLHPRQIDIAYLRTYWRMETITQRISADWPATLAWAAEYCAGATNGEIEHA